jgi:hypothetical protein
MSGWVAFTAFATWAQSSAMTPATLGRSQGDRLVRTDAAHGLPVESVAVNDQVVGLPANGGLSRYVRCAGWPVRLPETSPVLVTPPGTVVATSGSMISCVGPLVYLAIMNLFSALRLLSVGERDKDAEILALRHQVTILERQLGDRRVESSTSTNGLPELRGRRFRQGAGAWWRSTSPADDPLKRP